MFPRTLFPVILLVALEGRAAAGEPAAPSPAPVAWWRMEGEPGARPATPRLISETNTPAWDARIREAPDTRVEYRSEVPAPFIHDPLTLRAWTNRSALLLRDNGSRGSGLEASFREPSIASPAAPPAGTNRTPTNPVTPLLPSHALKDGFTLELFVKPESGVEMAPGETLLIAGKTRADTNTAAFEFHLRCSETPRLYHWLDALVQCPGRDPAMLGRHQYGGRTHVTDGRTWRHLALVHDATNGTVSFFCDYERVAFTNVGGPLAIDEGAFLIGGPPGGRGMPGLMDEVRLTGAPLEPWQFLRATATGVTNAAVGPTTDSLLPPGHGATDVKLRYGAAGDGVTDDTRAIQKALRELADKDATRHPVLYFPAGTYLISEPCQWARNLTLQGEGANRTVLRLKDGCPGFASAQHPKPVLATGNWKGGEPSMSSWRNGVFDLAIDAGCSNAGAIGLDFQANPGTLENVVLRAGEGSGAVGLDFSRPWPGPSYQKNLRIEGFDTGVHASHRVLGLTFANLELAGQRTVGIRNDGNCLTIERLQSSNAVTAILNAHPAGLVTVLHATLLGGSSNKVAIDNRGCLYARDIVTTGYQAALSGRGTPVDGSDISEYVAGKPLLGFGTSVTSLGLPDAGPPSPPREPPASWLNVADLQGHVKDGDWSDVLQNAIDAGHTTLFFPAGLRCEIRKSVRIRGRLTRMVGLNSGLYGPSDLFRRTPMLVLGSAATNTVALERLELVTDFEKTAMGVLHTNGQPLVISHCAIPGYRGSPDAGPLVLENVTCPEFSFHARQRVWVRHLNIEATGPEPALINDGAGVRLLGLHMRTEGSALINRSGAQSEILGGLVIPTADITGHTPMFDNVDSSLSAVIAEDPLEVHNYETLVRDTRNGDTRTLAPKDADTSGGRPKLNLYISNPPPEPSVRP